MADVQGLRRSDRRIERTSATGTSQQASTVLWIAEVHEQEYQ